MARRKKEELSVPELVSVDEVNTDAEVDEIEVAEEPPKEKPSNEMTLNDILEVFNKAYEGIPFYGTFYEIKNLSIGAGMTPARAYSTIGMLMFDELEKYFYLKDRLINTECEMDELTKKFDEPMKDDAKRKLQSRIDLTAVNLYRTQHDMNEAMQNIGYLYAEFKKYPRFTRQDLEAQESKYHITNAIQSGNTQKLADIFLNTPEEVKTLIEMVRASMSVIPQQ
jgi:hypothetical protein